MKIAVILPTMNRPNQAVRCIQELYRSVNGHEESVECLAVVEQDLTSAERIMHETPARVLFRHEHKGAVYGWNEGARRSSWADAFILAADDISWPEEGWIPHLISLVKPGVTDFIGFNDGHRDGWTDSTAHFLATRQHCQEVQGGVFLCPHYLHYGCDNEAADKARGSGRFHWAEDILLDHMHPQWGTAEPDPTYGKTRAWAKKHDGEIYNRRKDQNFPVDWERQI